MNALKTTSRRGGRRRLSHFFPFAATVGLLLPVGLLAAAQPPAPPAPSKSEPAPAADAGPSSAVPADREAAMAEADRRAEAVTSEAKKVERAAQQPTGDFQMPQMNYLELALSGGPLMIPIGFMSLLAVTFAVERWLALRRSKVMPPDLIDGLGRLASQAGGLDPRAAYRLCQQFPSAAANVIRSMLLKVGRPHSELEHAVAEADDREAARLYSNVRWLNLSASVAPLLGLLGTVQGMIMAFFVTANLPTGANKAQKLAEGIYIALVTTFAGLCVAIPAAIMAHLFESQIEKLFRELDETLMGVLPQLEKFEGRLRVSRDQFDSVHAEPAAADKPAGHQPAAARK